MGRRFVVRVLAVFAVLGASVGITLTVPATSAIAGASPPLSNSAPCSTPLTGTALPTGPAVVSAATTPYGKALVIGAGTYAGCSLYMLTSDSAQNPNTYGCTTDCAVFEWPALLTTGRPMAGPGVNRTLLGTVQRTISGFSVTQVTYGGHPLYRFFLDTSAGQTTGEELFDPGTAPQGVWYLVSPGRGVPDAPQVTLVDMPVPLGTPTSSSTANVLTALVDPGVAGLFGAPGLPVPVYTFSADAHHKSACTATPPCGLYWPPLLSSGTPIATGTVGGQVGTAGGPLGLHDVTYDGQPLHLFSQDAWLPIPTFPGFAARGTGITAFGGVFSLVPAP